MSEVSAIRATPVSNHLTEIARMLDTFLQPEKDPRQIRKREQILGSATELFVRHGYKKTSMEEVARAAGIAKGTVYLYYQNKAELLFHAIAWQWQHYMDEVAAVLDPAFTPVEQLRGLIVLSIVKSRTAPLIARVAGDREIELVLREIDDDTLQRVSQMDVELVTSLIAATTDGTAGDQAIETRARLLVDLLFSVINSGQMIDTEMPLEEYAHTLADVVIGGIVPESAFGTPSAGN
jgi:AcrR family transcriptional regulator